MTPTHDPSTLTGRELDALVAEKVMGWTWWERPNNEGQHVVTRKAIYPPEDDQFGWERFNFYDGFRPAQDDTQRFSDWDKACGRRSPSGHTIEFGMPGYSADPAASRELMKAMEAKGWGWQLSARRSSSLAKQRYWAHVYFGEGTGEGMESRADADTPERSLSIAAILAMSKKT